MLSCTLTLHATYNMIQLGLNTALGKAVLMQTLMADADGRNHEWLCYLRQHRARQELLLLGIIEQAGEGVLWAMLLLVCHGLQAPVVPDVPYLHLHVHAAKIGQDAEADEDAQRPRQGCVRCGFQCK